MRAEGVWPELLPSSGAAWPSSALRSLLISPRLRNSVRQVHTRHAVLFQTTSPGGSDHRACLILWLPAPKAHGLAWPGFHASGPQGSRRPPSKDPPWPPPLFFPRPLHPPPARALPARAATRAALMGQVAPQLGISKGSLCIET